MKKSVIIVFILISNIFSTKIFAQTDSAYDSIKNLNLDFYASKPVDSFLNVIPQSYNYISLYGVLSKHKIGGMGIRYASGMTILIRPKKYIYMNPIDVNDVWDINLFKKEIASYILIIHPDFERHEGSYP